MLGPSALFTDLYQITMAEAYFSSQRHLKPAVFELFFRKCPFGGEYAVLGGYDLVLEVLNNFKFTSSDIQYLKTLPHFRRSSDAFFTMLESLDLSDLEILGLAEGSLIFPRAPVLQVRGPVIKAQILESALLNAINFSTLVTTYARRIRLVARDKRLTEFGLRRAQGPNGAMTATRSSYLGGFDGTSNVLAGKLLNIPGVGTMAHSFIQSFWQINSDDLIWENKSIQPLLEEFRLADSAETNEGELAAFISYAKVFPEASIFLVDTYDTLKSGVPNAIRVLKILRERGFTSGGIRLDSGDLVYLSREARKMLDAEGFQKVLILASNELDEDTINSLQDQGACIDNFAVGTRLVTASEQPALGGVYKMVEFDGRPRMKISQQTEKLIIPGAKKVYRLFGRDGKMLLDLMTTFDEPPPQIGQEILALHPSDPFKKALVKPAQIRPLLEPLFRNGEWFDKTSLRQKREQSLQAMTELRSDISRRQNPTPYKVSLTPRLKEMMEKLFNQERPPTKLE